MANLFWIKRVESHIKNSTQLILSGNEITQIAESAQQRYQKLVSQYQTRGDNRATAEMYAESEVMRTIILPIGIDEEHETLIDDLEDQEFLDEI